MFTTSKESRMVLIMSTWIKLSIHHIFILYTPSVSLKYHDMLEKFVETLHVVRVLNEPHFMFVI